MRVEIICIGDELLIGQTVNTNAAWMGEQLVNIGVQPEWTTTVGDSRENMLSALRIAESRADEVLITGGLGPTHDDITKEVVTDYFGGTLVLNREILENIRERLRRRGIEMAKVNEDQALVPDNAQIMENVKGTAPGMIFRRNGKSFFVMPGVPFEMKDMMTRYILPELKQRLSGRAIRIRNFMTTGVAESTLFTQLDNLPEILKLAQVAFLPSLFGVKICLMATAASAETADDLLQRAEAMVKDKIGGSIYAEDDVPLEVAVARLLLERKATLSVAESCTGGMVGNLLTNIPGSSNFFERGLITYSNRAKIELLGVPPQVIEQHGAVSAETAVAMAEGVRRVAGTDYGISVTGIAGPDGGTAEKPVGLVYVACADQNRSICERHLFANDRIGNKQRSTTAVLNLLRRTILGIAHG
jgi:nicotinamide-nucleotide amidase